MPINGGQLNGKERFYHLGRECKLFIEGEEITGAADVSIRELVTEVDATSFNAPITATAVVMRTYEISFSCPEMTQAKNIRDLRERKDGHFYLPQIVDVTLEGGHSELTTRNFTIHEIESDEPLDGVVVPRFLLKEWGAGVA